MERKNKRNERNLGKKKCKFYLIHISYDIQLILELIKTAEIFDVSAILLDLHYIRYSSPRNKDTF